MFGSIGGTELLLIMALALIIFGPRKLPDLGRSIGKAMAEFRRASFEFRNTLEREIDGETKQGLGGEVRQLGNEIRTSLGHEMNGGTKQGLGEDVRQLGNQIRTSLETRDAGGPPAPESDSKPPTG